MIKKNMPHLIAFVLFTVLVLLSNNSLANSKNPSFKISSCGQYQFRGLLQGSPDRLIIWHNSSNETVIKISGDCSRCKYYEGLFVEAQGEITMLEESPGLLISKIKAITEIPSHSESDAITALNKKECKNLD